ncbi:hypothetical protein D3C73_1615520 [compost metagenome]
MFGRKRPRRVHPDQPIRFTARPCGHRQVLELRRVMQLSKPFGNALAGQVGNPQPFDGLS